MMTSAECDNDLRTGVAPLIACSALLLIAHFYMGNGYGFHRDELQFLENARHLQWGFVPFPPLTSFCCRVAIALFGISPQVLRLPAALVNAASLVLTGLLARELGGRRPAQIIALFAAFPVALAFSSLLQYNTFDLFAWTIVILFTARVLRTGDDRNWIGVGVGVGLGVLSKYSIALPVVSLAAALFLLPSQRRHLRSRWLWFGALTAAVIAAPNLIWLARHHFITLEMEHAIHTRDVRIGRADSYFSDQIKFTLLAFPLAVGGLLYLLRSARFRLLSAFYIGPFLLFALAKGRGYYLLPAYPVLYAAGSVALETVVTQAAGPVRFVVRSLVLLAFLVDAAAVAWAFLPVWPPGSPGWNWQMRNTGDAPDEVGWPEFVAQVAAVRNSIPATERGQFVIVAENYGEAGALSLYGPRYQLPSPISLINDYYDRGYGAVIPEKMIITGASLENEKKNFESCHVAAVVQMPYGVRNEESQRHPEILVCRQLRRPWTTLWQQKFG